ncbi:hypothetical protein ACMG5I_02280 [Escherichia coli]|uniref:hypothetical protein n=1 Tax=Escherichia coli TaxID=562 RepID=UPI0039BFD786|nr:hypothetical protein [Escherichia coli]
MANKIYGGIDVTHNVTVKGKRSAQSINDDVFDENGNLTIDAYTQDDMLEMVGMLPISRYGTQNYLPAGVNGTTVGSSENVNSRNTKLFLEDDNTLVMLRPGTNGSTQGVYYSYMTQAVGTTNTSRMVNTTRAYKPNYFGAAYAVYLYPSSNDITCGLVRMENTDGTYVDKVFVSDNNGTLNDAMHTGIILSDHTAVQPFGAIQFVIRAEDGALYFFSLDTPNNTLKISVTKVTFNPSNNPGGGTYSITRITGWTTRTFYNAMIADENIVPTMKINSTNANDTPYVLIPSGIIGFGVYMTDPDLYVAQKSGTSTFKFRLCGDMWMSNGRYDTRPQHSFSMTFDVATKQCALDNMTTTAPVAVYDNGSSMNATGPCLTTDPFYLHAGARNIFSNYCYVPSTGDAFCSFSPNLAEPLNVSYAKYPPKSLFDLMDVRSVSATNFINGVVSPRFGSAVGSYQVGVELLPNNSTKQYSRRSGDGRFFPSYAVHKSTPNFTFKSLSYGTVPGYEPTPDRNFITTPESRIFISSISGSNVTTNGGVLVADIRTSTPISFDYKGNVLNNGTISMSQDIMNAIRNSEFAKVAGSWDISPASVKTLSVFVPQQTDIPVFAVLAATTNSRGLYIRMIELGVNTRTGDITTWAFKRLVHESVQALDYKTDAGYYLDSGSIGITIYDAGSFYFIGGGIPGFFPTVGNTASPFFRATVDKASKQFNNFHIAGYRPIYALDGQPFALPGIGFGILQSIDLQNKTIFRTYGTTLEDYNAWTDKGNPFICVVSQDVAQGFIIYFTEETPVLISGKHYTLPISNIDLTKVKANPANTTFYVYIKLVQGIAKYHISTTELAETQSIFWIGTVKTNDLQITEINIVKRSRLDLFGASYDAAGSSFPVSSGFPSGSGNVNW